MARIFVIEDNEGLRSTICSYLELEDHIAVPFSRLRGLEDAVRMQQPALLILDVMLPDGDGFIAARQLRRFSEVPIIFLTARTAESDRITGFEVGGDDYLVKPFSNKELMLRVRALLKRTAPLPIDAPGSRLLHLRLQHNPGESRLQLDPAGHRCRHNGTDVTLTAAEWKILNHLAGNPGVVVSRDRLLGVCLDYLAEGSERTIDTHIKNIRTKLGKQPWIETVRGFGYRFSGEPVDTSGDEHV
ncbi:response regulator transcription factor [Spirochaeta africana]|uniref:Response regulator with CheY-like receiver domain and winged-helix DNA-binding domain n=1 Tax=Spirochaeta africana (strain ATCC 700263 / DSM 8902 / Z-7692) TaxID=889378 RepID=H9ULF5_SPIAZ|nr:response regulator transcription factor [Spirochaeta africana]AFG38348.1 response regulator with CheY-like receiver domain and winged-helix DNA-binding domain [Spirochaeta africana DSM 8902]